MVAENEKSHSPKQEAALTVQKDDKGTKLMSHKEWKKLKRKQKRQLEAKNRKPENADTPQSSSDEDKKMQAEKEREMQDILFLERENLAQQLFQAKIERQKKEKDYLEEQQRKIKEEWEELQELEAREKDRRERDEQREKDRKESLLKEATSNENKNAWHNPIAPVIYNSQRPQNDCPFFKKTGACKYGDSCSRTHEYPEESNTVVLPGMFTHFRLDQTLIDEYDTDLSLEYEDTDIYNSFLEFYQDVLPEFQSIGKVIQFKVCSNCAPHLRGNVYVSFEKPEDAAKAVIKFNGRWYAGKQLNCEYRSIEKWKSAICGLFFQNSCPKGNVCNFLHVFKNPNNEFRDADYDYQYNSYQRSNQRYFNQRSYRRSRSPSHRRSRYRSRERYRSRSRSISSDRYKHRRKDRPDRSESRYSRSPSRSRRKDKRIERSTSRFSPYKSPNHSISRSRSRTLSKSRSRSKSYSRISRSKRRSRSKSKSDTDSEKEKRKKAKRTKKSKKKKKRKVHSRSRSPPSILKQPIDHDDINLKINDIFGSVNSQKLDAVLSGTLGNSDCS